MRLPLKHTGVAAIIAVSFAILPLATDTVVASLPGMGRYFGVSASQAQITLSVFVIAVALSQLIYGPLSDRYGRRPVLIGGGTLFALASVACTLAPDIETLIAARFIQGLGCCAPVVVSRAVVRDIHGAEGAARMMSYISSAMAMIILAGPMIGGALEQQIGWRAVFVFLTLVGALLIACYALLLPESNPHVGTVDFDLRRFAGEARRMLGNRRFLGNTLCVCGTYCVVMSFLSAGPFVLIDLLGLSPQRFGMLFGLCILGYVIGTLVGGRLMNRFGALRLMGIGTTMTALAGLAMLGLALAGARSAAAIFVPYVFFTLGNGFVQPAAMAGAIAPFPKLAGTASAVMGFLTQSTGAIAGYVVVRLYDNSPIPMTLAIAAASVGMFASYRLLLKPAGTR